MKSIVLILLLSTVAIAQSGGGTDVVSPQVQPDRKVTFRLAAPKATEVALTGDWLAQPEKMTKDQDGLWSVTVGPMEPGLAIYGYTMDGVAIADPINPKIKLRARTSASLVDVPGDGTELWEPRDVPHGTVNITYQRSHVLNGETREFRVYTPPGYDQNPSARYPVMYLLHGSNDLPAGWIDVGRAHMILDNLIAAKKAVPMIFVLPWGHAVPFGQPNNDPTFERYLLEDVIPTVEKSYRVAPGRQNRAIVGLSMGGGQALGIGFGHLDLFSAVAAFSSAIPRDFDTRFKALLDDPNGTNAKLKLLWIGCGREDSAFDRNRGLSENLTTHKIRNTFLASDGRHTYTNWRKYLIEVAPLLFRN